jgi:hypothetical protein
LIEDRIHIDGVPQNDHVHYQAECTQLIFLSLAISLVEFAALAMKNVTRQAVPAFAQIELLKRASPARLVVDEVKRVDSLVDAADLGNGLRQMSRAVIYLGAVSKVQACSRLAAWCRLSRPEWRHGSVR